MEEYTDYTFAIDQEFKDILRGYGKDEYKALEESIVEHGRAIVPITVWNGTIVDGHRRYLICKKYSLPYTVVETQFESREAAKQWIIETQLVRRNLAAFERVEIAERYRPLFEKEAKERQGTRNDLHRKGDEPDRDDGQDTASNNHKKAAADNIPGILRGRTAPDSKRGSGSPRRSELGSRDDDLGQILVDQAKDVVKIAARSRETVERLAKIAGVSSTTYRHARAILESNNKPIIDQVRSGEISINKGYRIINEESVDIAGELVNRKASAVKALTTLREVCQWLLCQAYELDGEIVTDRCRDEIQCLMDTEEMMFGIIDSFDVQSDTGIISVIESDEHTDTGADAA